MTKDEIALQEFDNCLDLSLKYDKKELKRDILIAMGQAMDEYAKQMALAFYEHEESLTPEQMSQNYDDFIQSLNTKQP